MGSSSTLESLPRSTPARAVLELRRCAGAQFDPTIVAAFCEILDRRSPPETARAQIA